MFETILREFWAALDGDPGLVSRAREQGGGALPSAFATTDLAAASIAAAGLAVSEYSEANDAGAPALVVDRRLAFMWFSMSMRPIGWKTPPVWDPIAGDYRARDGWIELHTNAPHHRAAAVAALGCAVDRDAVAAAVATWSADELESAVVAGGGCAAAMRSAGAWRAHPQGASVAAEPLMALETFDLDAPAPARIVSPDRPLAGVRVLDLTRILAGPVATRFLAGYGADVLRIDPPDWDEPTVAPEVALGKRCARLDLKSADGLARLHDLLRQADVVVHGYRSDALDRLGLDAARRRALRPDLIDVSLDAYGWTGPWRARRGFDSLVQMSSGVAHAGMTASGRDSPVPLPVQALDHATGYLMAAAVVRGLTRRRLTRGGCVARTSLARMAALLVCYPTEGGLSLSLAPETPEDLAPDVEASGWGPMKRLRPPLTIDGAPMRWATPAPLLGSSPAAW